jgi:glycosyltransferase involved in cell wall biosynthesis
MMMSTKKRMKVALLSYDFGEYCIRLANGLLQEADVCLLIPQQLAEPHLAKLNQSVNFQPFHKPRLRQPAQQIRTNYTLLQRIRNFDPDVIHIQQGHFWFNLCLPLLRRYPLVLTIHDPRHHLGDRGAHNTPQKIIDFGFHSADQLIAQATQIAQFMVNQLDTAPEKVHVIPHIVLGNNTPYTDIQTEDNLILFFGRIWEYKGLDYLIRAEPLITRQIPEARIIIAGEGEDFTRYRRMMVNPEHFTVYNEFVSHEKRAQLFQQASIVVLPYVEASQSGVIPLAYTFEKPVVATTVGGLPDMVDHGQTGYLVPPRDEQALADVAVRLLQNKELCYQLGKNGKRKIETECSPDVVARQTLAVYYQAINGVSKNNRHEKRS